MKKVSKQQRAMETTKDKPGMTVGLDLGDRYSHYVQSAQYNMGRFGPDSALRRWGLKLAASGGKRGKKRAIVAVARKLTSSADRSPR